MGKKLNFHLSSEASGHQHDDLRNNIEAHIIKLSQQIEEREGQLRRQHRQDSPNSRLDPLRQLQKSFLEESDDKIQEIFEVDGPLRTWKHKRSVLKAGCNYLDGHSIYEYYKVKEASPNYSDGLFSKTSAFIKQIESLFPNDSSTKQDEIRAKIANHIERLELKRAAGAFSFFGRNKQDDMWRQKIMALENFDFVLSRYHNNTLELNRHKQHAEKMLPLYSKGVFSITDQLVNDAVALRM